MSLRIFPSTYLMTNIVIIERKMTKLNVKNIRIIRIGSRKVSLLLFCHN